MAFGTMTSRILGQLRESLLAYYFDKRITDAWNAAFRLPNMFRRLLGEGSLSVSFIPIFVESTLDSKERAQNLVNSVYSFLLLILGVLTAFGIFYPDPLLNLVLDPAYIADTEKYLLTLRLTKIMFGFIFFISSFAFAMGVLNALGQFAFPALAPTFFNICLIISTVLPHDWFPVLGDQLAWGVLIGGAVQAAVLIPALIKSGYIPRISFDFKNADYKRVLKNMGPGLIGMGLLQFTTVVNLNFSSSLMEGTISYINYVDRLIELPLSLISVSLGTALLPILSSYHARKETQQLTRTAQHYLELNLLLSMAAAAGLYFLAQPLVDLLFGRGKFKPSDVLMTSEILKTYCWIMIFSSGVRVLTPAYFAVKNTWFPAVISAICLCVHIILAPLLISKFQVFGLMISTTTSAALNFTLLMVFYPRMVGQGFNYLKFFMNVVVFALLAVLTGAASSVHYVMYGVYLPKGGVGLLVSIGLSIGLALVVFVGLGRLLGVNAIYEVLGRVQKRFLRR